jgi:hypothetical protein
MKKQNLFSVESRKQWPVMYVGRVRVHYPQTQSRLPEPLDLRVFGRTVYQPFYVPTAELIIGMKNFMKSLKGKKSGQEAG